MHQLGVTFMQDHSPHFWCIVIFSIPIKVDDAHHHDPLSWGSCFQTITKAIVLISVKYLSQRAIWCTSDTPLTCTYRKTQIRFTVRVSCKFLCTEFLHLELELGIARCESNCATRVPISEVSIATAFARLLFTPCQGNLDVWIHRGHYGQVVLLFDSTRWRPLPRSPDLATVQLLLSFCALMQGRSIGGIVLPRGLLQYRKSDDKFGIVSIGEIRTKCFNGGRHPVFTKDQRPHIRSRKVCVFLHSHLNHIHDVHVWQINRLGKVKT